MRDFIFGSAGPSVSPHKHRTRGFVGVRDTSSSLERYLVVLSNKGQWMLPGGFADGAESSESAARRELREESGFLIKTSYRRVNHSLFTVDFDFSTVNRHKVFQTRKPGETTDFGFVSYVAGSLHVTDYSGNPKKFQHFRKYTPRSLLTIFNQTRDVSKPPPTLMQHWYGDLVTEVSYAKNNTIAAEFKKNKGIQKLVLDVFQKIFEPKTTFTQTTYAMNYDSSVARWVTGFDFLKEHAERSEIVDHLRKGAIPTKTEMILYRAEQSTYFHQSDDSRQPDRDVIALSLVKECAGAFQGNVECYKVAETMELFPIVLFRAFECEVLLFQIHIRYAKGADAGTEANPHVIESLDISKRFPAMSQLQQAV